MDDLTFFLESSSISGLNHIASTKKCARFFWILVVIAGFTVAGFLIQESFQSWSESPIKTTVETMPISEIRLPKVTVCPPRNTYTDLNYDLMLADNLTLTDKMRDEIFDYAREVIEGNISPNNSKLVELERFYNWYHGYTNTPMIYNDDIYGLTYVIYTTSTSGVVTTQYYGEQFNQDLVERKLYYVFRVYPHKSLINENVTLHFNLEKMSMKELGSGSMDQVKMAGEKIDDYQTFVYRNFTPPSDYTTVGLLRTVNSEDLKTMKKLEKMPGFRLSWWFTTTGPEVIPDPKYTDPEATKTFVRWVVWDTLKKV